MEITYSVEIYAKKCELLDNLLKGYCCIDYMGGLLEKVLPDLYEINWIKTEREAEKIINRLRKKGLEKEAMEITEYSEEYEKDIEIHITDFTDINETFYSLRDKSIKEAFMDDPEIKVLYWLPF